MNRPSSNSKKIIIWLCANYGIFVAGFLLLGSLGTGNRTITWINFILDVALCIVSFVLNIILFLQKHKVSFLGKMILMLITLCLAAFTYYAFLMPESGFPPALFC